MAPENPPDDLSRLRELTASMSGQVDPAYLMDFALHIVEMAPAAILVVNLGGRVEMVNDVAEDLFGYPHGGLIGLSVEELMPSRLRAAHVDHRARFAREPKSRPMGVGVNVCIRRHAGDEVPVEIMLSPLTSGAGMHTLAVVRKRRVP